MDLNPGEAVVWYQATERLAPGDVESLGAILSADEQQRAARFVFEPHRRDFIAAHALVRRTLSRYATTSAEDWRFDIAAGGKPSVTDAQAGAPPLAFNVSHADGLVACAVARGPAVGVDVERLDRQTERHAIASRYFTPSESAFVSTADEEESRRRFAGLWTLKEAYLKAVGSGIAGGLQSCVFGFPGAHQLEFHAPPGVASADWQFLLTEPCPGYRLAVAIGDSDSRPRRSWRVALHDASPHPGAPPVSLRWSSADAPG